MSTQLASRSCEPCTGSTPPVTGEELERLSAELSSRWHVEDEHHLIADFEFDDFVGALDFTNRVGAVAEEEGHHPEIRLTWGRASVKIWTHAIDALSESDFILAAKIDEIAST